MDIQNNFIVWSQKYRIYKILIDNQWHWVRASEVSFELAPKILNYTARISEIKKVLPAWLTILNKTCLWKKHNIKMSWYCLFEDRQEKSVYRQIENIISQFNTLFI